MAKKILIVTFHYLNGFGGGIFATRAFINAFAELFSKPGDQVSLLYPTKDSKDPEGINKNVRIIRVGDNSSRFLKAIKVATGKTHRFYHALPELLKEEKFDLIVFDNSRASNIIIDSALQSGAKIITIHHNCELEFNRDNHSGIFGKILLYWTKRYEQEALRKSHLNLTLTEEDKQLLLKHYNTANSNIDISVIGVFESKSQELPSIINSRNKKISNFIITGNLSSPQTINSLIPWISTYYKILKSIFPDCKLTIAGKKPSSQLKALCQEHNIKLIASPENMDPILYKADCYICPTALGGGLKLRIMDGLRYGLPVLTHSISARGYGLYKKNNIIFDYDSTISFQESCQKIAQSKFDSKEIQILYKEWFSFESGVKRLANLIYPLLEGEKE